MKKIALFITCTALACAPASAQSLLERLGERAKNAAENNIGNKVEKGVNDILDGNVKKKEKKADKNARQEQAEQEMAAPQSGKWFCPECGAANTGKFCEDCGAKKPGGAAPAVGEANPQAATSTDFKRGEVILFEDDFTSEVVGEFPSKWDLLDGNAEVKTLGGIKAVEITDNGVITPLIKEQGAYLPEGQAADVDVFPGSFRLYEPDFYPQCRDCKGCCRAV